MFDYRALPGPKGQVELLETIGKGNFGYVYRVRSFLLFASALGNCKCLCGHLIPCWPIGELGYVNYVLAVFGGGVRTDCNTVRCKW